MERAWSCGRAGDKPEPEYTFRFGRAMDICEAAGGEKPEAWKFKRIKYFADVVKRHL